MKMDESWAWPDVVGIVIPFLLGWWLVHWLLGVAFAVAAAVAIGSHKADIMTAKHIQGKEKK